MHLSSILSRLGRIPGSDALTAKENQLCFSCLVTGTWALHQGPCYPGTPSTTPLIYTQLGKGNICDSNVYTFPMTPDKHRGLDSAQSTSPSSSPHPEAFPGQVALKLLGLSHPSHLRIQQFL